MSELSAPNQGLELALSAKLTDYGLIDYALVLGVPALGELIESSEIILDIGPGENARFSQDVDLNSQGRKRVVNFGPLYGAGLDAPFAVSGIAQQLPFKDASFGGIVSVNAVPKFVPRQEFTTVFAEILRVLRPGGMALLWPAVIECRNYMDTIDHADACLEPLEPFIAKELSNQPAPDRIIIHKPL